MLVRHVPTGIELAVDISQDARGRIARALAAIDTLLTERMTKAVVLSATKSQSGVPRPEFHGLKRAKADLNREFRRRRRPETGGAA